jgi:hypothetical protein
LKVIVLFCGLAAANLAEMNCSFKHNLLVNVTGCGAAILGGSSSVGKMRRLISALASFACGCARGRAHSDEGLSLVLGGFRLALRHEWFVGNSILCCGLHDLRGGFLF